MTEPIPRPRQKRIDSPKWLVAEIEEHERWLSCFPEDGMGVSLCAVTQQEVRALYDRALRFYARMHFGAERVPEPPDLPKSPVTLADLYALKRWCITVWPVWKRIAARAEGQTLGGGDMPTGEWSKPMSKARMMRALGIDSRASFRAWLKDKEVRPAGNRQTWSIRLDMLDQRSRGKLDKA
jgi:hypothetical protein